MNIGRKQLGHNLKYNPSTCLEGLSRLW